MFRKFVFFILILSTSPSYAEVIVAPLASTDETFVNYEIGPGKYLSIPLPSSSQKDDSYKIKIFSKNKVYKDITAYIVDQENFDLFKRSQQFRGTGFSKEQAPFSINATHQSIGQKYLILDNTYSTFITKKIGVSYKALLTFDEEKSKVLEDSLSRLYDGLKNTFIFDDFDVHVRPCGQANAFSESYTTGNIHICTELIDNLKKSKNPEALPFIFFHELGHSLLGLWKLPANNNEDIADEFATYLMLMGGAESGIILERSLDFWRNKDSKAEVINMIKYGDRHSLSIQRIRNIEENIRNSKEFNKRWSVLIYPHMTDQALESIIEKTPVNSNIDLAKSILKKRGKTTNKVKIASNNDVPKESITKRLEQIKNLYQKGLITQKEYDNTRTKILNEL